MAAYLTFDVGTTALKTAVVREDGRVLALKEAEYALQTPAPGRAEMAPERYWRAAVVTSRTALSSAAVTPEEIRAIGFSSQAQSFVALDEAGEPLTAVINWLDTRALEIARRWEREWLSRELCRRITGYPWLPEGLTVFKIAWLAEHQPEVHAAADRFLCLPDYLIWRMTGEAVTDFNIAQMSGLLDLRTGAWSEPMMRAAGVDREQLPSVHPPATQVGGLRRGPASELGLRPDTPVCLGCNDQLAGAIGAGNVRPGIVSETTGTALAVVVSTGDLLEDHRFYVGRHAVPDTFYAMPYAPVSGIVLTWFRDLCGGAGWEDLLREAGDVAPGSEGLCVLPHFAGTASPTFNPDARGAIVGCSLGHGRPEIARAIMESCACLLREVLEPMSDHDVDTRLIRSLGRPARSDLWLQMKADMLGTPVERPKCPEAASLGAAILAATGTGQFRDIVEAAEAWYRPERRFDPNPAVAEAHERIYARYLEVYRRLYGASQEV